MESDYKLQPTNTFGLVINDITDKYYVPEKEELHIGVRIKMLTDSNNSTEIQPGFGGFDDSLGMIEYYIERGEIVIKCLDQSDIEELGWVRVEDDDRMYHIAFENGECSLYFEKGEEIVITSLHKKVKNFDKVVFHGYVKNYNELKKLMEMLRIGNETK